MRRHLRLILGLGVIALLGWLIVTLLLLPLSSNKLTLEEAWAQVPPVSSELEALLQQVQSVPSPIYDGYDQLLWRGPEPFEIQLLANDWWPSSWKDPERRYVQELAAQVQLVFESEKQLAEGGVLYERVRSKRNFEMALFASVSALESSPETRGAGWQLLALMSGIIIPSEDGSIRGANEQYGADVASLIFRGLPRGGRQPLPYRSEITAPPEVIELARTRSERRLWFSWLIEIDRMTFRRWPHPSRQSTVWWLRDRFHAEALSTGRLKLGVWSKLLELRGESGEYSYAEEIALRLRRDYEVLRFDPLPGR